MLKISNLSFKYRRRDKLVLNDFSLHLNSGGIYGLLGRNGAGKTTLLHLIAGLLKPTKGEITYMGKKTWLHLPSILSDTYIVPEEFTLPNVSLKTYIECNAPFYPNFNEDDLRTNLRTFELEDIYSNGKRLGSLSMGQKKKVYMCFALACNTSLLIMDEPTNGLDIPGKSAFRRFIVGCANEKRTIIISTHQVRDIDRILDHVIIIDDSRVLLNEDVSSILNKLKFADTTDNDIIGNALYSIKSLSGASVITTNDDDSPTELNLETLFDCTLCNREKIIEIFKS